jgi:predicted DNA-binding transcriptional regulator YafY
MQKESIGKIRPMKLWEILSQETDEEHPIGTQELLQRLAEMNIDCTRKTLYADIALLNQCGYEVMSTRGTSNLYYVMDRKFDVSELRILSDAVQAAGFVTERKTKEFVDKIAGLAGSRSGEVLKQNLVAFNKTKNTNESIYYNVSEITRALNEHRKIEFMYFDYDLNHKRVYRKNGQKYVVSPYATICAEDHYYLVCHDGKHAGISHYRVDRMDRVMMREDEIDRKAVKDFDLSKHKKAVFGMFIGKTQTVRFAAHNSLIDHVFDKFGDSTLLEPLSATTFTFTAEVQLSPNFYGWCCSFGDKLVVMTASVKRGLAEYVASLHALYTPVEE